MRMTESLSKRTNITILPPDRNLGLHIVKMMGFIALLPETTKISHQAEHQNMVYTVIVKIFDKLDGILKVLIVTMTMLKNLVINVTETKVIWLFIYGY